MSTKTGIEWTDATWNPVRGCSRVSEGCRNCYAETIAKRFSGPGGAYEGLVRFGEPKVHRDYISYAPAIGWNGQIQFVEKHLLDPLKWKAPRRIFVNSMSDLFHENVTDEMRDRIFAVMALCPQHTFQVLTKRPERMLAYLQQVSDERDMQRWMQHVDEFAAAMKWTDWPEPEWPLPNVWLGVSVENQKTADERIPLLLQTPAAVRFLSCEPLLGPVDLAPPHRLLAPLGHCPACVSPNSCGPGDHALGSVEHPVNDLDWVICGGESGPGARPMHPEWARSLRDQCQAAGVPFFFKQWGEWYGWSGVWKDTDVCKVHQSPLKWPNHVWPEHVSWGEQRLAPGAAFVSVASTRCGKKIAGRLLDGREWSEFPEVRA